MTAYFISGLGADKRIFQKLQLPADLFVVHLEWIKPLRGETMQAYSRRLAAAIDTSEDFVLVGLSFGGMIATEISQVVHPSQTIIVSSAGCSKELPWYFRLIGLLKIDTLVSPAFLKRPNRFNYWFFGVQTNEERLLLDRILKDSSPTFLKWAIRSMLSWKRQKKPAGIVHIHGSADRVLPAQYVKANIVVPEGGHLMVFGMPEVISRLLIEKLGYS